MVKIRLKRMGAHKSLFIVLSWLISDHPETAGSSRRSDITIR